MDHSSSRSTQSQVYKALVWLGVFLRANSWRRRATNIMSFVERVGREPLCFSKMMSSRLQLEQDAAGVWRDGNASVVAALPRAVLHEHYLDGGVPPLPMTLFHPQHGGDKAIELTEEVLVPV